MHSMAKDGRERTGRPGFFGAAMVTSLLVFGACGGGGAEPTPSVVTLEPEAAPIAEVPAAYLEAVLQDAARLTGSDRDSITIVRSEPTDWADGRLGCVQIDDDGTEPVDGYWVLLEAPGLQLDYRLDAAGVFRLCGDPIATSAADEEHEDHDEPIETDDS